MPKHPYPKHPNKSERGVKTMEINKNKEIYRSDQRNEIDNLYFHPHGGSHDNRWPNLLSHVIIVLNLSNKNSDRESENKTTPGIGVEIWEEGRGGERSTEITLCNFFTPDFFCHLIQHAAIWSKTTVAGRLSTENHYGLKSDTWVEKSVNFFSFLFAT